MEIKKTGMFCLNATLTRTDAKDEKHNAEAVAWSQKKMARRQSFCGSMILT